MAPRPKRLPFDSGLPVIARREISVNGRRVQPGDRLDWRRMGVSLRRVHQMYAAGKLRHPTPNEEVPEPIEVEEQPDDSLPDLEAIDSLSELKEIADRYGAPYKVSKAEQRQAIRDTIAGVTENDVDVQ